MNLKTFEVFRSALQRTLSSDDDEVLQAIRQANSLLLADNKTWRDLLAGKVTVQVGLLEKPPTSQKKGETQATDEEIEYWFEEVLTGRHSAGFREFLESLHEQWGTRRYLTSAQINALKEAYERSTKA